MQRRQRIESGLQKEIARLEAEIAQREQTIRELEASMAMPDFYTDRAAADPVISRHAALMWEVGDLLQKWEALQTDADGDARKPA